MLPMLFLLALWIRNCACNKVKPQYVEQVVSTVTSIVNCFAATTPHLEGCCPQGFANCYRVGLCFDYGGCSTGCPGLGQYSAFETVSFTCGTEEICTTILSMDQDLIESYLVQCAIPALVASTVPPSTVASTAATASGPHNTGEADSSSGGSSSAEPGSLPSMTVTTLPWLESSAVGPPVQVTATSITTTAPGTLTATALPSTLHDNSDVTAITHPLTSTAEAASLAVTAGGSDTSTSTNSTNSPKPPPKPSSSDGAIIGAVVAALVMLVLLAAGGVCYLRRQPEHRKQLAFWRQRRRSWIPGVLYDPSQHRQHSTSSFSEGGIVRSASSASSSVTDVEVQQATAVHYYQTSPREIEMSQLRASGGGIVPRAEP